MSFPVRGAKWRLTRTPGHAPCRRYEQESYEGLVKTIEGQDLLPQVGRRRQDPPTHGSLRFFVRFVQHQYAMRLLVKP